MLTCYTACIRSLAKLVVQLHADLKVLGSNHNQVMFGGYFVSTSGFKTGRFSCKMLSSVQTSRNNCIILNIQLLNNLGSSYMQHTASTWSKL